MNPFALFDSFQVVPGQAPIAVGAPHHGSRPNVDADQGAGPIALALAAKLGAGAVVVHDLRRVVDVNKDPSRLSAAVRGYARRYQNELFRASPRLVIEVHGHAGGRYEVEAATGFDLDPAQPGDARFLEKLAVFKQALPAALAARIGRRPTVGVYPLDRDVHKTATATFTFQKIRRARNLAGVECYGLHLELSRELRLDRQAPSPALVEAVSGALATAIGAAFDPLPVAAATIPVRAAFPSLDSPAALLAPRSLKVRPAPEKYERQNVVVVHPTDLESLGALDGDAVILRHGDEELRSAVTPSRTVPLGCVALPARVRRQIGLGKRGRVTVGRPAPHASAPASRNGAAVVVREARQRRARQIWLGPAEIERMGLATGEPITAQGRPGGAAVNSTVLRADATLPPRSAAVSTALMNRLTLTLGEVIVIREGQ